MPYAHAATRAALPAWPREEEIGRHGGQKEDFVVPVVHVCPTQEEVQIRDAL
jgi:hypothetical protein